MIAFDLPLAPRGRLEEQYNRRAAVYHAVLEQLEQRLRDALQTCGLHATVKGRVKSFSSLYQKLLRILRLDKPGQESVVITDLVGLRIVCPFVEDVSLAERCIRSQFHIREVERKGADFSVREFGYESVHCLLRLPGDLCTDHELPRQFDCEVQLRTILQDAWAEVEHELVYKSDVTVFDETVQRKLAALNANLTLADITFQEIRDYQRRLHGELQQRRRSVWQAVAEATDGPGRQHDFQEALEAETPAVGVSLSRVAESQGEATTGPATAAADPAGTLDDQLLAALKAHNAGSYDLADQIYSQILARGPRAYVRAVILIHRGMVRFVSNRYRDALSDFSDAVEIDPGNWRALYFRGIVYRVLNDLNQAAHDFTRSLSLDPYQVECLLQRAGLYLQIGREDEALADCDAALSLEPEAHSAADLRDRILERKAYQRPQ